MDENQITEYIVSTSSDIASIKTTLEETLRPLVAKVEVHDTRLDADAVRFGAIESEARVWKRVFGGLFTMVLVAGAATVNWLKG